MNPCPHFLRSFPRFSSSLRSLPRLRPPVCVLLPKCASSASFQSAYSIDKIYPGANARDIANLIHHEYAKQYSVEVREKFSGFIPPDALQFRYMRSSGPGGQSVNTSNSKVEVRFNLDEADWIPIWIKKQFMEDQKNRINKKNEFVITSEVTRTQLLNQADCMDRIRHYIREAEVKATPKEIDPEEVERMKKSQAKANERRLVEKKRRSNTKSGRGTM